MNNKRCGTCRHWRMAENGLPFGECTFLLPKALPMWVHSHGASSIETDGHTCQAWEKTVNAHDLCGEILQTLRTIFMRGTLTTRDNAQFGSMLDEWSTRLLEIKR